MLCRLTHLTADCKGQDQCNYTFHSFSNKLSLLPFFNLTGNELGLFLAEETGSPEGNSKVQVSSLNS